MMSDLVWGQPSWAWPAAAIAVTLSLLVIANYFFSNASTSVRMASMTLKLIAIVVIAVCLVEPKRRATRPVPRANLLPILVDSSRSMQIKASREASSRFDDVIESLSEESPWLTRLSQSFDVRRYRFDRRLESVNTFTDLKATGTASSIAGSMLSLSQRLDGRPIGGVMLFTDGNSTDQGMPDGGSWADLGFPVYPVVTHRDHETKDLRIVDISVAETDFESAPTTVTVRVDSTGLGDESVVIALSDVSGKWSEEQTVKVGDDSPAEATFRFRPEHPGLNFFSALVFAEVDRDVIKNEQLDLAVSSYGEATLVNNRRIVTAVRNSGPYRVLYVAGRPNWEFKFLRRALDSDAEIQLVGLVRIANKEAKFNFRDRGVSDTNPLFAGLGKDEEDIASQYDEPVILRFGVKESDELSEGFPDSDEELFAYHAVILDDLETGFFSQDQMLRLRRFVSSRGGGLLMLGGQESFASKSFGDSPLGELSPVYAPRAGSTVSVSESGGLESGISDADPSTSGSYELTREGLLQPWTRLRDTEQAESERARELPTFQTINQVGEVKPGASRLATVSSIGPGGNVSKSTAIAVQRFGKGRTAAIPIGDLWRWSMKRKLKSTSDFTVQFGNRVSSETMPAILPAESGNARSVDSRDDPGQAWRQTVHWLVGEVPKRVELRIEVGDDANKPVDLWVEARDEAFLPLENASVTLEVSTINGDGEMLALTADADPSTAGLYRASYWPSVGGGHRVVAKVKADDESEVGSVASGWTSELGSAEFADLRLNADLLAEIARQTGGRVIDADELDQFAKDLPNQKVPVTETWVYPLWHRSWVLLVVLGCLCGEWGLRRWKGLA